MGNIIVGYSLFNIPSNSISAGPFPFLPTALNDRQQVVGGNVIYNWLTREVVATISSPADFQAYAINSLGDVVGESGEYSWFYPGDPDGYPFGPGRAVEVDSNSWLLDINDNKIAVGWYFAGQGNPGIAFWVNAVPPFFAGYPAGTDDTGEIVLFDQPAAALAINNKQSIVGYANSGPGPQTQFAFVTPASNFDPWIPWPGPGEALNLNNVASKPAGWSLITAVDINEGGVIVGQAANQTEGTAGYVAIPRNLEHGISRIRPVSAILQRLLREERALSGGGASPRGPANWNELPPERRDTLLSFAISNLAGLMSEGEMRSEIERLTAEGASRVQNKRSARPPLTEAQKQHRAKVMKLLGRR